MGMNEDPNDLMVAVYEAAACERAKELEPQLAPLTEEILSSPEYLDFA